MSIVVDEQQFNEETLLQDETLHDLNKVEEVTSEPKEEVLDALEDSIEDNIPDKFKGKELNDVINSYRELEKELGRKNNEVGELRKVTDDFIKQQLEPTKEKENHKIDLDDLLENPDAVIQKALDNNPKVAELEKQLQQAKIQENKSRFEGKHSDWQEVLNSDDFKGWLGESSVRQQMFIDADKRYDYDMADELFTLYKEVRGAAKSIAEEKATTKRKKALKAASSEKGSTPEVSKKVYRRADLIRLKQTDKARYNDLADDIYLAYQEGRVR